ncbi:MAG: hypothetical protein OET44_08780 [Gammaproteobacteria bacterium]|nr:hypothetical protein [Gammaproteobacteria bacterium]
MDAAIVTGPALPRATFFAAGAPRKTAGAGQEGLYLTDTAPLFPGMVCSRCQKLRVLMLLIALCGVVTALYLAVA